jgi:hypothetical protein
MLYQDEKGNMYGGKASPPGLDVKVYTVEHRDASR